MGKINKNLYLTEIIQRLKRYNPQSIILFGSSSTGNNDEESDIDLLVILDSNIIPQSFEEKIKIKMPLRKAIRDINRKVAIDLLVYTKREMEIMREKESNRFKDIIKSGKTLYEKVD